MVTETEYRARIRELESKLRLTEQENRNLKAKVTFFSDVKWLADGLRGEQIVAQLLTGKLTRHNARNDFLLNGKNLTFEFKFSNRNLVRSGASTYRWTRAHVLGADGRKRYDHLILVGEADPRFRKNYKDANAPYVLFDLPFDNVEALTERFGAIQIITNPRGTWKSKAKMLYEKYQITKQELLAKYTFR